MKREELVLVELKDGTTCRMAKKALNVFLAHDKVARFKRSDGWVDPKVDPLRDLEKVNRYTGVERRAFA